MIHIYCIPGEITMNTQNNKTHKKTTSLNHKHSYRKLRRWVLPAVLGAALSTLAFLPTFAEGIPSAPPAGNPPMSAPNGPVPKAEANPNTFTGTTVVTENKAIAHELISNTTSDAVFATGEGSVISVENTNIHTKSESSRGLDATYKGTVNGRNLTITTEGAHSATLATDRGEGTITAEAAKLTTSGEGSPIIYSTGNITADYITGEAKNSEIGVVEGKNSITLTNSNVTGYKDNGFMLYQSFSGDAESGIARFKAENNSLTTHATGAFIYVNNTTAEVDLTGNAISTPNTTTLAKAAADSRWGKTGENGGHLTLRASNQALNGNIVADAISTIALDMTNESSLVGAINTDNTAKEITLKLSKDSTWTLTGDSYVKSLTNEDTTGDNIHLNGYKLVVADK